jgi:hypothetical protein
MGGGMAEAVDPNDPASWPAATVVVRCGIGDAHDLEERLSRDVAWSVFTDPSVDFADLAASCRNNRVRRTTVGEVLAAGGSLERTEGPPHHHDLRGLTPEAFHSILGGPELNPVPLAERWTEG